MNLEYKRKTTFSIPFESSAKLLISANYTTKVNGGSYKDRMFELEFSDHYNEFHKPIDEFGLWLFIYSSSIYISSILFWGLIRGYWPFNELIMGYL